MEINGDIFGTDFGEIKWKNGKPFIRIVNNLYEGQFVNLEKPLLLWNRSTAKPNADGKTWNCEIESIIERKLLFNVRPKPIINITPRATR